MDQAAAPVFVGVPAGWLWLAIAALAPAFVAGDAASPGRLAISLGGILFAQRAFGGIAGGLAGLARAAVAWQQVADLFAAGRGEVAAPQAFLRRTQLVADATHTPLIDATALNFRHRPEGEPALARADLRIGHGERILLEGASGAGKSTLAALLTGLRTPQSGLLLLGGWDRATLGDDWHRLAASAPQFHENHVLSGTLAFNLLMGREWPASLEDLHEAEQLCHELGLGELLARMPSGLQQRVGETGWQLSHGERSRIFLARALLQRAPLTVMDESFAALDPQTLATCLCCAMARTQALVVIAHP
jgi:ATP-binding cassette subfamily B protein